MTFFRRSVRSLLAIAVTLSLIAGTAAHAEQNPPKITDIIVIGNKSLNRTSIIATSGLKIGDSLTQAVLDQAKKNLLATGYYGIHKPDPTEGVTVKADIQGDAAKVVIDVDENDVVQAISISGSGPILPDKLQAVMATKQGQVLNLSTLQKDVANIRDLYTKDGYQAVITEELGIKDGILSIPIAVGTVSSIKLNGLKKTRSWVVTREMKQKPGAYFNANELRRDLTRLLNTDLFEGVEPAFSYPAVGKVDLTLNMQEKRTGTVELAVGYGSRGLVGRAGLGENNFMGRAQQVNVYWETGGRANKNSIELGFTEPWLDKKNTSLSVNLFDKTVYRFAQRIGSVAGPTTGDDIYFETHTGGQVTLSRPFSDSFRGYVGLRLDSVKVPVLALNITDAAVLQNGPLATLNLRVTHNTRDLDLEPAAGGYEVYSTDIGKADLRPVTTPGGVPPTGVFGNVNYTRLQVDARRYFSPRGRRLSPKDKRSVFALRLMAGTSTGTLPFSEQYFVGGAESLRGYNEDRFWGKNMLLGSFEFRHPLASSLTGVLFADAGDAWGGPYQSVRFSGFTQHSGVSLSVGAGIGLRVITPIGPIRIDQGFGREGSHTHFSIGHVF